MDWLSQSCFPFTGALSIAEKNIKQRNRQLNVFLSTQSSISKHTFFLFATMRVTSRLLQSCRITLFSRENCGLCTQARSVLSDVWDQRPFAFKEIDIIKPESKAWRDLYEFDVPVVSLLSRAETDCR